jgi:hypothetical protein
VLNGQAGKTNIPHDTTAYYGRDHETYVWNTKVYNRKNRTDAVGTANFDYIDYLKMFCKGAYLRSTLHVEAAEASLDLHIYRRALREVSLIFGGPAVSLAARLAALKPSLGTIYTIDWGAASNITAGPKINNITSAATGAEILNLVSDEGVISSIGFKVVAQFTTAATKVGVVTRGNGYFRGMDPNFNIDSAIISPAVTTGLVEFNNLPAGTYTILIYPFTGDASPLDAQIRVVINAVQKDMYAEHNTYYNIKYTGLSPDGSNKITIAITSPGAAAGRIQGFDLIKE